MRANTHVMSAILTSIPITLLLSYTPIITTYSLLQIFIIIYVVSTLMPDIDHEESKISKHIPYLLSAYFVSKGHRGATHKLSAVFIYGLILSIIPIMLQNIQLIIIPIAGMLGYLLHLLMDGITVSGIRKFVGNYDLHVLSSKYKFKTGSEKESKWYLSMQFMSFIFGCLVFFFNGYSHLTF